MRAGWHPLVVGHPADTYPLMDRERELATIGECFERARVGNGGVIVLEGAPGYGKSALLRLARGLARGMRVLSAGGDELERTFPFGVVRGLFEQPLAELAPGERRKALRGPAGEACAAIGLSASAPRKLAAKRDAPRAASAKRPAAAGAREATDAGGRIVHGLYWLTVNLAVQLPLALLVDDLHWVDGSSLHFLAYLIRRLEGLPVAILLASRPPGARRDQALQRRLLALAPVQTLALPPIGESAIGSYAQMRLNRFVTPGFAAAAASATGGVPFLVEQLISEVERRGYATDAESAGALAQLSSRSLERTVRARISELSAEAGTLAYASAILGAHGSVDRCAELARLKPELALDALDALSGCGLARCEGRRVEIAQPIIRRALLADLSPGAATRLHLAAARVLDRDGAERAIVAAHLLAASLPQAEPQERAWALDVLIDAARQAFASGDPAHAARLLRRALVESPTSARRAEIMRDLGAAEIRAGEHAAVGHLRVAAGALQDLRERAGAFLDLGLALLARGDLEGAGDVLDQAIEALRAGGEEARELILRLEAELLAAARIAGAPTEQVRSRLSALGAIQGESRQERLVLGVLAFEEMISAGKPAAGARAPTAASVLKLARAALAGACESEHTAHSPPLNLAAYAAAAAGDLEPANAFVERTLARAQRTGSVLGFAIASCWRAHFALRGGDLRLAEADARACFETEDAHRWRLGRPAAGANLVEALLEQGRLREAQAVGKSIAETAPEARGMIGVGLRIALARLAHAQGDWARAAELLLSAGAEQQGMGAVNPALSPWRALAALALRRSGRHERASALVAEELELARAFGAPRPVGIALLTSAQLASEHERERALLEEALSVLAHSGARLELARAQLQLGALRRRLGERRAGAEHLLAALDLAERCGAGALCEQAREELASAGLKPRRAFLTGPEALTGAERRVAALAASGLSNREIAEALFVSIKTVETHLRHIYQKLCIGSRRELSGALEGFQAKPWASA